MELPVLPSHPPNLGDLEKAVLEDLWEHACGDAKEVHSRVGVARSISLNTVQSTLERLHRKQLLSREKISHAYQYTARVQREELMGAMIAGLVGSLGQVQSGAMLSAFVDFAVRADHSNLDRLEALIAARRAEQDDGVAP
ncbi:penicillinase repressor [Massilia glaciei]|uniref:Penicillinase repressor n=2 Tax=Massilia glaciei TaxID=1524097 RepID=A0A2U2HFM1_9BURK|nr:penicillinase repressor [Massilia glaciei]